LKGIIRTNFANRLLTLNWTVFPLFLVFSNRSAWKNPGPQFHSFSAILSVYSFWHGGVTLQTLGKNKYRRTIAYVLLPDSTTVNHKLVKDG
jgi:hypothetical protein